MPRLLESSLGVVGCEDYGDQAKIVSSGRRHDAVAGGAIRAGFDSVCARIAADEFVCIREDECAVPESRASRAHHFGRERIFEKPSGENGEVPRARQVGRLAAVGRQSMNVYIGGIRHPELLRAIVHQFDKYIDITGDVLGDGIGGIVGRADGNSFEELVYRKPLALGEVDLLSTDFGCVPGYRDNIGGPKCVLLHAFHGDERDHHFDE